MGQSDHRTIRQGKTRDQGPKTIDHGPRRVGLWDNPTIGLSDRGRREGRGMRPEGGKQKAESKKQKCCFFPRGRRGLRAGWLTETLKH